MKKNFLILSIFVLVLSYTVYLHKKISSTNESGDSYFLSQNSSVFNSEDYFLEAISYWPKLTLISEQKIKAGIVPHHLPASPMIAHFFSQLNSQQVETVFLFAPNHEEKGNCKVITTNEMKHIFFESAEFVCGNETVLKEEHGITIFNDYIEYYLANPTVYPIVMSNYTTLEEVDVLVEMLKSKLGENDVLIGSVDFSHYLSYEKANENDEETLRLMKEKNYEKLLSLDHQHLDSPESVVLIMKILEQLGFNDFNVVAHENFVTRADNLTQPSTSYFEIIW